MTKFFTVLICCFSLMSTAQSYIDVGTKWTYTENDFGILGPTSIEIVGDTLIDGVQWFKQEGTGGCASDYEDVLIRETADSKVYTFDLETGSEALLYDYTKTAGESWVIPGELSDIVITVNSVGTINFFGVDYNVQYIDYLDFGSIVLEGIGCFKYFFPQGNNCDPHYSGLRCFTSEDMDFDFDPFHDCDHIFLPSSTEDNALESTVKVYPNPVTNILNIDFEQADYIQGIEICDTKGQVLKTVKPVSNLFKYTTDLSGYPRGVYVVKIKSANYEAVKKIIKI